MLSKIELLRLKREKSNLQIKIDTARDKFAEVAQQELTKNKSELSMLTAKLHALKDRMLRTAVRSPVNGIVKQIYINTVGGVIQPGMKIMEIVPLNDKLLVEAHVKPADIED